MLAPASKKRVRKAIREFQRRTTEPCPRGEIIRKLFNEADPRIPILRPTAEDVARVRLIHAGVAFCTTACGGCALTRELAGEA